MSVSCKQGSILFVEDELKLLRYLRAYMEPRFQRSYFVANFDDAVSLIRSDNGQSIDIIVSDYKLESSFSVNGDRTGLELFKLSRSLSPDRVHILSSAIVTEDQVIEAIETGVINRIIAKPVRIPVLYESIEAAMNAVDKYSFA